MKTQLMTPAAFAGTLLICLSALSLADSAVLDENWAKRLVDVDGVSEAHVEAGEAIGVETLIIRDNKVLLHRAYGVEDIDTREELKPGAIWSVKSMTKPMVALAVLMLVDEGKVALHEPISTWLPDFAGDKRVTVLDLLSHKSGVAGLGSGTAGVSTLRPWVETWAARSPAGPMGKYTYSDFNYAVAALIVSERSGMPTEEFVDLRILKPLGMKDSYLTFDPSFVWADRVPSRYVKRNNGFVELWDQKEPLWYPFFAGGWGLWTTAKDYAKFLQFIMDGGSVDGTQLVNASLIELSLTPHTQQIEGRWSYGLGWRLHGSNQDRTGPVVFAHNGFDGTEARVYPETRTIVLLLTHSRGSLLLSQFRDELVAAPDLGAVSPIVRLVKDEYAEPDDIDAVTAAWVGEYSGTAYRQGAGQPVSMKIFKDGKNVQWTAQIQTPSGVIERSAVLLLESPETAWQGRARDGSPYFLFKDRKMTLSKNGRLALMAGDDLLAEVNKKTEQNTQ